MKQVRTRFRGEDISAQEWREAEQLKARARELSEVPTAEVALIVRRFRAQ